MNLYITSNRLMYFGDEFISLTKSELWILKRLYCMNGAVVSKVVLYDDLYVARDHDNEVTHKVIDVFICKLRKKLGELVGQICIETVWGVGIKWAGPEIEFEDKVTVSLPLELDLYKTLVAVADDAGTPIDEYLTQMIAHTLEDIMDDI